jgi:hypothetical protein
VLYLLRPEGGEGIVYRADEPHGVAEVAAKVPDEVG